MGSIRQFRRALICCVFWIVEYGGMWAGKWCIAALVQRDAFINSLFEAVKLRSSTVVDTVNIITRTSAIQKNLSELFSDQDLWIFSAAYCLVVMGRRLIVYRRIETQRLLFIFPMIVATGWMCVMANHSYIHSFFTYRGLAPTIMCVLLCF